MASYLTLLEAAKRTQNKLFQGIALGLVQRDELAAVLPFRSFEGQAAVYLREGERPTTEFLPDDGAVMTTSTGTTDRVVVPIRRIGSDVEVDTLANDLSQGQEMGHQIAAKSLATWELVKSKVINGKHNTGFAVQAFQAGPYVDAVTTGPWVDSNRFGPGEIKYTHTGTKVSFRAPGDVKFGPEVTAAADGDFLLKSDNPSKWIMVTLDVSDATADAVRQITFSSTSDEFDGMNTLVDSARVIDPVGANGDDFSLSILDNLLRTERVRTNRVLVMSSLMKLRYLEILRALGGTTPEHVRLPGYSGPVDAYRGVPILECDNILDTEVVGTTTDASSIYCASLDPDTGLFLGVPAAAGRQSLAIEGDPRRESVMGFRIQQLGAMESAPREKARVYWYGLVGLRNTQALARARGIKTAA